MTKSTRTALLPWSDPDSSYAASAVTKKSQTILMPSPSIDHTPTIQSDVPATSPAITSESSSTSKVLTPGTSAGEHSVTDTQVDIVSWNRALKVQLPARAHADPALDSATS